MKIFNRLLFSLMAIVSLEMACAQQSEPNTGGGNVWSRVIDHYDGTKTKSVKNGDANTINEEKYDKNGVMVAKRLFALDSKGRLRRGIIMDAKANPLGSTEYGYDKYDRIVEQRVYDTKARLTQRVFPPGTLAGVPANAKHTITFFIDPTNPNNSKAMQTSEPLVQPVNRAEDAFVPGVPGGGGQQTIAPAGIDKLSRAEGRKASGMFPIKKAPERR